MKERGIQKWRKIIEDQEKSGLTVYQYCADHNIKPTDFPFFFFAIRIPYDWIYMDISDKNLSESIFCVILSARTSEQHMKYYSQDHLWLEQQENGIFAIGLTPYAVSMLSEITYLEFSKNAHWAAGEVFAVLESIKIVWELKSPGAAEVLEYHTALPDNLQPLNADPENKGWLCRLQITNFVPSEWMIAEVYQNYIKGL